MGLHRRQLTITFALERRGRPQIKGELGRFAWRDGGNWDLWMLHSLDVAAAGDGNFNLSKS